jgi:hypothetical protein
MHSLSDELDLLKEQKKKLNLIIKREENND